MSMEYGNKLNPIRKLRKAKGIKGERMTVYNTHNPDTIDPNGILTVRFPDLGPHDVIIPGTAKLSFKIALNALADANRTIVNNLGRAIVSKIEVKLEGQSVYTLNDSDIFHCYQDLWMTQQERENSVYQGIQSEALRKIRINAGDKGANASDVALGDAYSNLFSIPLDFELLEANMPFHQYDLKDRLSYELTFNNYGNVIVSSDNTATYTITGISMEFEVLNSKALAMDIKQKQKGRHIVLYDRVIRHTKLPLNKNESTWNITLAPQAFSMKGILIIFKEPQTAFNGDSEDFYNPKITKVSTTIDGKPNQIYSSGMRAHQQFHEIRKHFSDGKNRDAINVAKEFDLADVTAAEYFTNKYALWLDFRSNDDLTLHGSGRKIEGASQSIQIEIEKTAQAAGALNPYIYYIADAQLNFENGRLVNVAY